MPFRVGDSQAQAGGGAFLGAIQLEQFPVLHTQLKVYDAQGRFVHNLTVDQVEMLEDGGVRQVDSIRLVSPGSQVAVAINPGPSFAIRNNKAVSRYDLIKDTLRAWARARSGSSADDLSLVVTNGPAASHSSNSTQWLSALELDKTDARKAEPSLDTLGRAISLASDPTPRPGMGRAVLFITPPPEGAPDPQAIENLTAQANTNNIPIHVWLVSSSGAVMTQAAQQMMQLAADTGGQFFNFTGDQALPDIESYLEPLRHMYEIAYTTGIAQSGAHTVAARVHAGEASIETAPVQIEMDLAGPAPAFIAPPLEITRRLSTPQPAATGATLEAAAEAPDAFLAPQAVPLQVVFDFPDGRKRAIVYSALLVDGAIVAENQKPPFDHFTWSLESYTSSGLHKLQVQVRDELGLTGSSLEIPVQVSVDQPQQMELTRLWDNLPVIAALVAVLAGGVLFLVMVMGGKLRPRSHRVAERRKTRADPVTQPVRISNESGPRHGSWMERLQLNPRPVAPQIEAFLNPTPGPDQNTLPPIPIPLEGLLIGSDATQAGLVLDDPSVDKLHARLTRQEDGSYRLADAGSAAGVWVNYTPVSQGGLRLEHGDLIHIGRIGFRFTLRQPGASRKPVVITSPREDSLDDEG